MSLKNSANILHKSAQLSAIAFRKQLQSRPTTSASVQLLEEQSQAQALNDTGLSFRKAYTNANRGETQSEATRDGDYKESINELRSPGNYIDLHRSDWNIESDNSDHRQLSDPR